MDMDEAEQRFMRETEAARLAYESGMMSINSWRDAQVLRVKSMHRELLETIREIGQWRLGDAQRIELQEMEEQTREVERQYRARAAPTKAQYERAIAPAQARLQEARTRGRGRSPSELAKERSR